MVEWGDVIGAVSYKVLFGLEYYEETCGPVGKKTFDPLFDPCYNLKIDKICSNP